MLLSWPLFGLLVFHDPRACLFQGRKSFISLVLWAVRQNPLVTLERGTPAIIADVAVDLPIGAIDLYAH